MTLRHFWLLGAAFALLNIPIYRAAASRKDIGDIAAKEVARSFTIMLCIASTSSAMIGVIQFVSDIPLPIVPFVPPAYDSIGVRAAWGIAIGTVLALLVYINSRDRFISYTIAEILMAGLVRKKAALRAVNIIAVGFILVALILSIVLC